MANSSTSDEFSDVSFWDMSSSIEVLNSAQTAYADTDFSSARGSLSSHVGSLNDGIDGANFFPGYAQSKISSPDENGFGHQLPSPLGDGVLMDPAMGDKERRREQNRVAQRAFRERKESKLKQLEHRVSELKAEHRSLERKYNNLRTAHLRLQSGLRIMLDASGTFDGEDTDATSSAGDVKRSQHSGAPTAKT